VPASSSRRRNDSGLQFKAAFLKTAPPTTLEGIERYLDSGMIKGIGLRDVVEGVLAARMADTHESALACFRRAALAEQTFAGRELGLKYADKLVRSFAALTDALNRHRGKGQQLVRVEHVHVHPGGQAIVGAVTQGGGGGHQESEDQPHAPGSIAHEPEPPLRCPDAQREALPVPGGGRPETLPDARRIPRQRRTGR
jgi:hypothetical protein